MTHPISLRTATVGLVVMAVGLGMGACPIDPTSLTLLADAGSDQVVAPGATVTLDGSHSTSFTGATLSFLWTQTAGTTVTLVGTATSKPMFVAPSANVTLTFQLTVSDGTGATSSDSMNVQVTAGAESSPVANAGHGQTVSVGTVVTLDGSASSDPDGDTLTYAWTQTVGTTVALNDANTPQPTFVAQNVPGTLTFKLTVSDGTLSSSATVDVTVLTTSVLLVANLTGNSIVSFASPATLGGNIAPDHRLAGSLTRIAQPTAVAADAGGHLIVCNSTTPSLSVYFDAINTGGNQAPAGVVLGTATQLTTPVALAINPAQDLLFVADTTGSRILVFRDVSKPTFTGAVAPARTITSTDVVDPVALSFVTNGDLYVACGSLHRVVVFANASTASGPIAATRIISSSTFVRPAGVFVDNRNTLYVLDSAANEILIFTGASTLKGVAYPQSTVRVSGAAKLAAITVDRNGTGYITDSTLNAVYVYAALASRNGLVPPDRTLQGANTGLDGPARMFLLE